MIKSLLPVVGRRDYSNYRSGLRLGLQEVPGVWRQRRGNQETDWKPSEKSTSHVQLIQLVCSHTDFNLF